MGWHYEQVIEQCISVLAIEQLFVSFVTKSFLTSCHLHLLLPTICRPLLSYVNGFMDVINVYCVQMYWIELVTYFRVNNNGPNGHLFYVGGDLMMRRGMLPIIMLPDGDLSRFVTLGLGNIWILFHLYKIMIIMVEFHDHQLSGSETRI